MKEDFVLKRFSQENRLIITAAEMICQEYAKNGYRLTLRQLYYQFVSRQPLQEDWANNEKNYNKLGIVISDARLAGLIDWDMIEDRGRTVEENSHWEHPGEILNTCAKAFRIDLWKDQPNKVMVMVEKQALEGVLEPICRELDIPFVANKGYSSSSAMYGIGKRIGRACRVDGKKVYILYLGDHDPSGMDMTRDVEERLCLFAGCDIHVERLALNMDQVRKYHPPENPAKLTDSRCNAYIREFGTKSWELDALEPRVLETLVRGWVDKLTDKTTMAAAIKRQNEWRVEIAEIAEQY